MIEVTAEPEGLRTLTSEIENCCFCRKPTRYWYTPQDVACCGDCARRAKPEDVPTKTQWCRRERIANPVYGF